MSETPNEARAVVAVLDAHKPEWRGSVEHDRVLWCCTCGGHQSDDYADFLVHLADVILASDWLTARDAAAEARVQGWKERFDEAMALIGRTRATLATVREQHTKDRARLLRLEGLLDEWDAHGMSTLYETPREMAQAVREFLEQPDPHRDADDAAQGNVSALRGQA